jgi:hypothetical protein
VKKPIAAAMLAALYRGMQLARRVAPQPVTKKS